MHTQHFSINPFATRYVSPGNLPWLGEGPLSLARLSERFTNELHCRAAIVGPHGTGKSTLLAHLLPQLGNIVYCEMLGQPIVQQPPAQLDRPPRSIFWFSLRRDRSPVDRLWGTRQRWQPGSLVAIDGFEQLPFLMRQLVLSYTRLRRIDLLVTTHCLTGLDPLLVTHSSLSLAKKIVRLTFSQHGAPAPTELTSETLLSQLLTEENGNMREVLMRLYDRVTAASPISTMRYTVAACGLPAVNDLPTPREPG